MIDNTHFNEFEDDIEEKIEEEENDTWINFIVFLGYLFFLVLMYVLVRMTFYSY